MAKLNAARRNENLVRISRLAGLSDPHPPARHQRARPGEAARHAGATARGADCGLPAVSWPAGL